MKNFLFGIMASFLFFSGLSACAQDKLGELSPGRIQQIASYLSERPSGLGQPIQNRAYWADPKRSAALRHFIGQAEKVMSAPLPAWNDDDYLEYSKVGSRQRGQKMLKDREDVIPALVYAECLENKGRFLPTLNQVLQANANDPTWTLPAHDGTLTSYHGTDYTVDLNASAFGYRLAETVYLLGDKLDPAVRDLILKRLEQRLFEPFRRTVATGKPCYWLGSQKSPEKNNWNPVCLSGVLGSALAVIADKSERAFYVAAAEHYSPYYLNSFTADGYCSEGGGYWNYGFGHYVLMREQLVQATGGKIDLFTEPHVVACVLYPRRIRIGPQVVPPFADCQFGAKTDANILAYCGQALGLNFPTAAYSPYNLGGSLGEVDVTPCAVKAQVPTLEGDALRFYFKNAGVLACRPSHEAGLGVGIKAGGNFSHSHNDVGSYEIALGDDEATGDPGGPLYYDKDSFGPDRLDKKLLNSYGHPVPVIGGQLQIDATKAKPVVLSTSFTADHDQFVINMAPAYAVPSLKTLTRTMDYSRSGRGQVVMTDEAAFTAPTTFEDAMETHGSWKQLDPQTISITFGQSKLLAKISASGEFTVKPETIQELGVTFTRIGLVFNQPCDKAAKVAITFTPQ